MDRSIKKLRGVVCVVFFANICFFLSIPSNKIIFVLKK